MLTRQNANDKHDQKKASVGRFEANVESEVVISEEDIDQLEKDFMDRYYTRDSRKPFATLLRLYRRYYRKLLLSVFFFIIKVSPALYLPVAIANIIDTVTTGGEDTVKVIIINAAVAFFLLLMNIPFHVLYIKYSSISTRAVEAGLRGAIARKLQSLSIRFNREMQSGRIQTKIIRDVEGIFDFSTQLLNTGIDVLINIATIVLVIILKGDWYVLAFFLLCGPIAVLTARFFKGKIKSRNRDFRIEMESTSARVSDMVEMIPITRAHGLGEEEAQRMTEQVSHLAAKGYRLDRIASMFGSISWVVMQSFRLGCLVFTVILALNDLLSVGDVTLYQSYFGSLVAYMTTVTNLVPIIAKGGESINSVGEILGAHDIEDNRGKRKVSTLHGEYEFKDVHFAYENGRDILSGLDLTVKAGETIAVVGESGAGKSTILNLVTGFYMATGGKVLVDGVDISEIDLTCYRKHIAVVPQTSVMFTGTIRDNITYGSPYVSEEQLQRVIETACLADMIKELPDGLDTQIGEHGGKLSGGQRQRISIARAIIRDPRVIILDEATSALDTVSEKHIQTAIRNLARGRTTIIVAHRLSTIKDADKIAVLKDGKCVEFGSFDQLMELRGEFYRFRNLQI